MYSYLDIKRREEELLEKIDFIKQERIDLVSPFYELKKQYPDTFGVLLDNYEGLKSERFDTRLEILIENIETSNLENKEELITSIGNVRNRFKVINNKERMYNRFLNETVYPEKEKRESYLKEVYIRTRIIEKKLEKNNLSIKEYESKRNELIEKGFEQKIIIAFNSVIDEINDKNENLKNELRKIYLETGLSEEIEVYYKDNNIELDSIAKDISKEILGESKEEKEAESKSSNFLETSKDYNQTIDELTQGIDEEKQKVNNQPEEEKTIVEEQKAEENNNPQSLKVEEIVEEKNEDKEENNAQKIDSVVPETPKKVINIHKASTELMRKIVKNGSIMLGVVAIATAVLAVLSNPVLIGNVAVAAMGGGLIASEIGEKTLKK